MKEEVCSVNILRLISELEGSYQLCKYMGFDDDKETLDVIKKKYYKLYFKLKREENKNEKNNNNFDAKFIFNNCKF